MDIRIKRTKAAVKDAFLELRKKKPIEKITVTELSKLAGINKATFYLHYTDIYKLSDEIEDEFLEQILSDLDGQEKFFDKPQRYAGDYAKEIFRTFCDNREKLHSVFSGSRYSLFPQKIEQRIKAMLYERFPDFNTRANDVTLTFLIQGVFHTIANCPDEDNEEAYDIISGFTSEIFGRLVSEEK